MDENQSKLPKAIRRRMINKLCRVISDFGNMTSFGSTSAYQTFT